MKNIVLWLLAAVLMMASCTDTESAKKLTPTGFVTDLAHALSNSEHEALENRLKAYKDSTTNEIAVLVIEKYDDENYASLFDYSLKIFQDWKIGEEKKNNGALLVVVKKLASKNGPGLRIVTGKGLEGPLTDMSCGRIIEGGIRPLVKNGLYYRGIDTGITLMEKAIRGEFLADSDQTHWPLWQIVLVVVIILLVIIVAGAIGGGSGGSWSSDGGGDSSFSFGGGSTGGGGAGD